MLKFYPGDADEAARALEHDARANDWRVVDRTVVDGGIVARVEPPVRLVEMGIPEGVGILFVVGGLIVLLFAAWRLVTVDDALAPLANPLGWAVVGALLIAGGRLARSS